MQVYIDTPNVTEAKLVLAKVPGRMYHTVTCKSDLSGLEWQLIQYLYWNTFNESPADLDCYFMLDRLFNFMENQMTYNPLDEALKQVEQAEKNTDAPAADAVIAKAKGGKGKPAPVAKVKAAPAKKEVAPAKKEVAEKKEATPKKAAEPKAEKVERPRKNGYTRPQEGTAIVKIWDLCDKKAKTKDGAIRSEIINESVEKFGVAKATAATQFGRWSIFTFGTSRQPK